MGMGMREKYKKKECKIIHVIVKMMTIKANSGIATLLLSTPPPTHTIYIYTYIYTKHLTHYIAFFFSPLHLLLFAIIAARVLSDGPGFVCV
jgi:hypothetical protein